MTMEQFIRAATRSGYCRAKTAREYAEGRESLTEDDFIQVYRLEQSREEREHSLRKDGLRWLGGCWTSRDYRGGRSSDTSG